ncbi:MAG TPA: nucleotidyltransferase family protein [Candidatus Binataceae bacterium]|nr:nucleotidyltransferase family protein [Candidatus Binataceae bacterium]
MKRFAAEARFVLACCAAGPDAIATGSNSAVPPAANLDWRRVIDLALGEGVMPSVYRFLAGYRAEDIPEHAMRELRFHFQGNSLRNRLLARELSRLTALLESHGITPIAFKGPLLAQMAYGDVALRQFSDLDLLVPRSEMPRVIEVLDKQGFSPQLSSPAIVTNGFFQASEDAFIKPGTMTVIDLHWDLMPRYFPFAPAAEQVRRRAIRQRLEDGEVWAPALHHQMLIACVHGTKHGWPSLGAIADVAALLRIENGYDWPGLYDEAAALGSLPMLLLGLRLAHAALAARVPDSAVEMARRDPIVSSLAPRLLDSLFASYEDPRISFFHDWMVPLRAIGRRRAQLAYVVDRAFAPTFDDWQFVRLPGPLFPLYYPLRPLRLLIQQTPRLSSALGRRLSPEVRR